MGMVALLGMFDAHRSGLGALPRPPLWAKVGPWGMPR